MAIRIEGGDSAGASGRWIRTWAQAAARAMGRDHEDIALVFLSPARMKRLNASYRGRPYATDVLSFPAEAEGDLGDIFIAAAVAEKKAAERGMSYRDYLKLLLVHSVLHLGGYDHSTDKEARVMEKMENKILKPRT